MRYCCFHVVCEDFITFCESFFCLAVNIFLDLWLVWCWWRYWDFIGILVIFRIVIDVVRSLVWNFSLTIFGYISRQVGIISNLSLEIHFNRLTSICFYRRFCKGNFDHLARNCHCRLRSCILTIKFNSS